MSALIWTVFATRDQAKSIAGTLLDEKLIGCANISPNIESIFLWNGNVDQQVECGMLIKTDSTLLKEAISRLEDLHPYETPAILGWHCDESGVATATWLGELTRGGVHGGSSTP